MEIIFGFTRRRRYTNVTNRTHRICRTTTFGRRHTRRGERKTIKSVNE